MKQGILLLGCLAAGFMAKAQTTKEKFVQYGLLIDRAKTTAAHGDHGRALVIYDSAFSLVPFVGYDYFDAVLNALAAGMDDKANDLLIQATENGFKVESRYDPDLQAFMLSERCMPYLNMRDYMKARWLAHADTAAIRKRKDIGSWEVLIVDSMGSVTKGTDPEAFDRLLAFTKEYGWPTPLNVGSDFYHTQSLLLNQLDGYPDDPRWQQILPYIRSAMDRGALPPDYLAPFQDLSDVAHDRPMTYGELLPFYSNDPSKWYFVDRETLNSNRAAIGRGSIEDLAFRLNLDLSLARFAEP